MEYMPGSKAFGLLKQLENMKKIKKIPKISLTAFSDESTLNEIRQKGCDKIVNKPITLNTLKDIYTTFLLQPLNISI